MVYHYHPMSSQNTPSATPLSDRLNDAIKLAFGAHGGVARKGDGAPYLIHPLHVLAILLAWKADEDTCIAGLLHDVIEDAESDDEQGAYRQEIDVDYGEDVLRLVENVTEQDKSLPWRTRKEQYLKHLETASEQSLLVSCADHTHNTASLLVSYKQQEEDLWTRFNACAIEKLWYINATLDILKRRLNQKYTISLEASLRQIESIRPYILCRACSAVPASSHDLPFCALDGSGKPMTAENGLCECKFCHQPFLKYNDDEDMIDFDGDIGDVTLYNTYWVPLTPEEAQAIQSHALDVREFVFNRERLNRCNGNFVWRMPTNTQRRISTSAETVSAQHFHYLFDDWRNADLTCSVCGWQGRIKHEDTEVHQGLFDYSCPKCDKVLAIVTYSTPEEDDVWGDAPPGDAIVQYNASVKYFFGTEAPRNTELAIELLSKSAEQDFPPAQFHLGALYGGIDDEIFPGVDMDDYLPRDTSLAVALLEKAASYGHPLAQMLLAEWYEIGFVSDETGFLGSLWRAIANIHGQYSPLRNLDLLPVPPKPSAVEAYRERTVDNDS